MWSMCYGENIMKYIRANILGEEDIYFINDIFLDVDRIYLSNKKSNIAVDICSRKDLESLGKMANNIEELCDEFDWKWNEKEFPYSTARQHSRYSGYGDLKRAMRGEENYGKYLNQDYEIYGAIWTDKGLIYVAKMNEKGELELL